MRERTPPRRTTLHLRGLPSYNGERAPNREKKRCHQTVRIRTGGACGWKNGEPRVASALLPRRAGIGKGGKGTGYYLPKYCPLVKEPGTMPSSPDPGGELRPPFPYAAPRRRRGELLTGFAVRIRTRWGVRQRDLEPSPGFQTPRTQLLDHGKKINAW